MIRGISQRAVVAKLLPSLYSCDSLYCLKANSTLKEPSTRLKDPMFWPSSLWLHCLLVPPQMKHCQKLNLQILLYLTIKFV